MRRLLAVAATVAVIASMILAPISQADTPAQIGGAICDVLDEAVTVSDAANKLIRMAAVIESHGYSDSEAAVVISSSVIAYCPYHIALVRDAALFMQRSGERAPLGLSIA